MKHKCDLMFPFILTLTLIVSAATATVGNNQCGEKEKTDFQNPPDGVCGSLHIRSNLSQFRKLENCTVVEGYLRISLMETISPEEYDKWSFPELREITAYLTLYRVYGLKSLKNLFPNLAIIGGRQLFNNYALVAFEMPDLEELGLVSLRTISRGGVRITKSKKLCYVDTVDWEFLGVDPGAQDFKDNKEESQCANYCPDDCLTTKVGNVEAKRCWTSQHCQQGLNCQCKMNQTCMDNGTCCHNYCLGGCSGTSADDCFSCKGVTYQGRCLEECPEETYKYADRRCLTAKECFSMANNTDSTTKNIRIVRSDKAEMRLCVSRCPQNYTVQDEGELKNFECIKCKEFCPKVCNGSEVNSIEDAQKLKDCSKITGSLVIQIMGGSNVAYEMEKSLGNIKEVTGSIVIRRSYALLTLYFLRNLEIIGGEQLYDRRSFTVMDNINLQDLFPEEQMMKMKIKNGTVSFQSNRKLCEHKIRRFVRYLNMTKLDNDIGITNGNLIPCIERELSLNVTSIYDTTVLIQWEKDTSDGRHVLAYIINYKEIKSKYEDINIYEGRDACSADVWMTNEVLHINESQPYESYALSSLTAYTHYAVYVQAYTLSTATHSAMTAIKTFRTNAYYPSEPLDLEVISDDPHELYVRWKPPKLPNGIVTHYKVLYQKQELDIKSFEQRDYCTHPISTPTETKRSKEEEAEKELNNTAGCCACPKTKVEREAEARKREIEIYFENYLHDQVYCKRYDTLPPDIVIDGMKDFTEFVNPGRSVNSRNTAIRNITDNITNSISSNMSMPFATNTSASDDNVTDDGSTRSGNLTLLIQEVIVNDTDIYLPNLEHFQEYSIEVQACHDTEPNAPSYTKLCSNRALTAGRTKASWVMDKINESTIHVQVITNGSIDAIITWEPPPKPNGLILTYNVFYKRAHQENLMPQHACVTIRDFQKFPGCRLTNLDPGNWTFRINAISLAGNGSLTDEQYFIVKHSPDEETKNEAFIIAIVAVLILMVSVIGVWLVTKYKFRTDEMTVISPNVNYIPSEPIYTMDGWEVDRDKIKLLKELGQGSFGMVYEGIAKGINDDPDEEIRVAVKTVNDRASFNDKREFLKEATTMKAFDCFHVVKLLGVVSTGQPALVIMELMALGDLKNYLREHRPDEQERPGVSPPKLPDILQMAGEIADGMAYLADKKFVHRDLAARNCMVAEDKTVKIGDFGMTRDIYETDYYRKGGKGMLPVRWMAPESLRDGVFTSMSDVWSYGVVMWEMVTLAAQPYQGLSNEEVVKFISEDNTMDIPDRCPQKMANLMQRCWRKKPKNRPTFKKIIEYLRPHLNLRFEKVSYFFNAGGGSRGMDPSDAEDPFQEEDSNDSCSYKSLSNEARAASQLSHSSNSGNHQYDSSPHPSGGSASQCDDGINPEDYGKVHEGASRFYIQGSGSCLNDSFEDYGDHSIRNELGADIDDSNQSFMPDDLQKNTWHSPMLSHDQGGKESIQYNSGQVELQPLIKKNYGPSASSSRLTGVHPPSLYPSDYIGHQTSPATTYELRTPGGSQTLQQHHKSVAPTAAVDSLASGSPSGCSQLGQSNRLSSGKQALSLDSRPALRLPELNRPPSGGFYRVSLHKQGDKDSNSGRNSQGNIQPSSSDWEHHQPSPATADASVVSKDETSPDSTSQHNFPPGAITSSSDDSKESSKSSGSYSHINGLKNGHIPMVRHRTAPC